MAALALGYVLLLTYLHYQADTDIQDPDIQRLFGGAQGASTLKHVDRVEAYLIGRPVEIKEGDPELQRYPTTKGPVSVPRSDVAALKRVLLDRKSHTWKIETDCKPSYGVRLDFIRGDDQVSLFVCFECDLLMTYLNGKYVAVENYNALSTAGPVVRSLFPDDAKIQSLLQ